LSNKEVTSAQVTDTKLGTFATIGPFMGFLAQALGLPY